MKFSFQLSQNSSNVYIRTGKTCQFSNENDSNFRISLSKVNTNFLKITKNATSCGPLLF